jgi:glycosyltransferase involved in cell wall biosynthesis
MSTSTDPDARTATDQASLPRRIAKTVRAPRVSVGLPVYNGERYLGLALDSLLGQTYEDFRLIISDNASTDATEEICRSYAAQDRRIRYERTSENRGAGWNFNHVFSLSAGEYYRWACHDDVYAPEHLETLVQELDSSPSVVLCYAKARLIDEDGEFIGDYEDELDLREEKPRQRLVHLLHGLRYAHPTYGLMRRDAVAKTRLMGGFPSADLVWLGEMALLGPWHEVPQRLFYRRIHPENSVLAHPTREGIATWYNPANKGKNVTATWRLTGEFLKGIHHVPLSRADRAAAYASFLPVYVRASRVQLAQEAIDVTSVAIARSLAGLARRLERSSPRSHVR